MTRIALVVLACVACGKSEPKGSGASKPEEASKPAAAAPPSVEVGEREERICRRLNRDEMAKILGIAKLTRTGGGTLVKGGGAPASLACSYYEGSKVDGGMSFGFNLTATTELEKRHTFSKFTWEPFDGLGQPAKIARAKGAVHLQTIAKGAQLKVQVEHDTAPISDEMVVAATKAVIAQLADDATADVR